MKRVLFFCVPIMIMVLAVPPAARPLDRDAGARFTPVAEARPDAPPAPPANYRGHTHGAYSRPWGADRQGGYGQWGAVAPFLNLSAEQRARMRDLWMRYYLDTRDLRYDLMQRRLEMRRLFTDPKVDGATLMAKHKEVSALQQRLTDRRAQTMIEWRALLTPEQIQKLDLVGMGHSRTAPGMQPGMMGGHMW